VQYTIVCPGVASIPADNGIRSRESSTALMGCRPSPPSSACRTVSAGSSASTVPMPVRIAPERARSRCTSARASGPVIHWLSPVFMEIAPSMLLATFSRTNGRPSRTRLRNPAFSVSAAACIRPLRTRIPAASSAALPLPLTAGNGSCIAMTTSLTPASTRAGAHGGVLPWCEQGSSVR